MSASSLVIFSSHLRKVCADEILRRKTGKKFAVRNDLEKLTNQYLPEEKNQVERVLPSIGVLVVI